MDREALVWTWLFGAIIWLGVIWAYLAVMHAKIILERDDLTLFWQIHVLPLAVIGLLLDVAFQMTFGTIMFLEPPRELLFSSRVQRHWRESRGWRHDLAGFWRKQLNVPDKRHIR